MVEHTLKILEHVLQGSSSVSDHIGTLWIEGLKTNLSHQMETGIVTLFI